MALLTKKQRKVLRYIVSECDGNNRLVMDLNRTVKGLPPQKVTAILHILKREALISVIFSMRYADVTVKPLGLEYFDTAKENAKAYLRRLLISKWCDIAVSFVTAVITYFLMPCLIALLQ